MKEYIKPIVELVSFATEAITSGTDLSLGEGSNDNEF